MMAAATSITIHWRTTAGPSAEEIRAALTYLAYEHRKRVWWLAWSDPDVGVEMVSKRHPEADPFIFVASATGAAIGSCRLAGSRLKPLRQELQHLLNGVNHRLRPEYLQ